MSGVLENMQAAIVALQAEVAALKAQPALTSAVAAANPFAAAAPAAAANPFATVAAAPATPTNVTAEQVTALITPYLEYDAVKAALGAAMKGMGINSLPETQPHQYGEMYQKFSTIIEQFKAAQGGATAATPTSII